MSSIIRQQGGLRVLCLAGCCVLAMSAFAMAATDSDSDSESEPDFSQYKILLDRNIFDATRDRPRPQQERPRQPRPTPAPNPDYLDVTGAFMQGDQAIVFFEGSKPDFNQAVGAGSQIAGAQLAEVGMHHVVLDFGDGDRVTVPVGSRLMIQADGATSVVERDRSGERRAPRASAASRRNDGRDRDNGQDQRGQVGDFRNMIQGFMGGGAGQFGMPGGEGGPGGGFPGFGMMGGAPPDGATGGPTGRGGQPVQAERSGRSQTGTTENTLSDEEQAAILERMRARREEESGQ